MRNLQRLYYPLLFFLVLVQCTSCASINISNYYHKNQSTLDSIEETFRTAYAKKPFSIEFTDRPFNRLSLELITDTLTYIYEYNVGEPRMQDTLLRYGYDTAAINSIISDMRSMECTWIDNLNYWTYPDVKKHSLIYISLWPRVFNSPFVNKKYYILTYFQQPQYYDTEGRLLVGRRLRRIRKFNAETFRRITDRVAFTISDRFR